MADKHTEQHESIKCTVVGEGAVGKTSLLMSYTRDAFPYDHVPTVFDTYTAEVVVNGDVVEISLWDTAGQAELDRVRPMAYPGTDIFLACFALNKRDSFESMKEKWFDEVRREVPGVPILLVGTKVDIRDGDGTSEAPPASSELISMEEGTKLAQELGAIGYCECSALTQLGLKDVFDTAFSHVLEQRRAPPKRKRRCTIL